MKLTQQARVCTRMKKEADVESDARGQEKLENNELCRRSGAGEEVEKAQLSSYSRVQVLVRSERGGRPLLSLPKLKLLGPYT